MHIQKVLQSSHICYICYHCKKHFVFIGLLSLNKSCFSLRYLLFSIWYFMQLKWMLHQTFYLKQAPYTRLMLELEWHLFRESCIIKLRLLHFGTLVIALNKDMWDNPVYMLTKGSWRTGADVTTNQVNTGPSILTWVRLALVYVYFTVCSFKSSHTLGKQRTL